ncbi:unnamed protein product [Schistosoma curassoni]|uniref:Uncharacterized protein n=1 Tax=Schistosoma curassoni TaxID=6186 RepID=A0A183JV65_9TREM|nr:unnamed protein product [Schistosoma curassoni]
MMGDNQFQIIFLKNELREVISKYTLTKSI